MSNRDSKSIRIEWHKYAKEYDPIKVGSIDGTDTEPHDRAIVRALNSKYTPNRKVLGEAKRTVFVGRLHPKTDEDKLTHKFRKCGRIVRCRVVRDIVTGDSKCYAFIEFESRSDARQAVDTMNKTTIYDYQILVDYECERTLKGWKPRRLGGGFGGKRESGQLRFGCADRPFQRPITTEGFENSRQSKHHKDYVKPREKHRET